VPRRQTATTTATVEANRPRRPSRSVRSSTPAPSTTEVKPWDLRSQEGLDRIAMVAVRQMAETLCRIVGTRLSTWARAKVTVRLEKLEQLNWQASQARVVEPSSFAVFNLGDGPVIVWLPVNAAMAVIDLHLGGTGKGPWPRRELTDLEQQLIAPVFSILSEAAGEAASSVFGRGQAGPVAQVGSSPSLLLASRQRQVIYCEAAVDFGTACPNPGSIVVCLPVDTLRPLFSGLGRDRPPREQFYALAERAAAALPLRISLCFPPVSVPVSVAEKLAPGQVVGLGHPIGEPLLLKVGGKAVFSAVPVEQGKRAACKLVRRTGQSKEGSTKDS
jgi:flagellar motor switch protein FliM